MNRRQFVTTAFGATVLGTSTTSSFAIEPIKRNGAAKFKLSLAAYSYRDLFSGKLKPKLTLEDFVDDCAALGLEGTELTSYYFPKNVTAAYLRELRARCFRLGLDVSGTAVGNDFCHPAGKARDEQIAGVKRWVENAAILGAPVIRIFSGNAKKDQTVEDARKLAVEAIETCCEFAGQHGVFLALENHGGLTAEADGLLALVQAVKSPWFGVNLDTGNFHSRDVYGDLAKLAPYSINVQVKASISPAGERKQASDYGKLAALLKAANYRGYVALEYEDSGDPRAECRKHLVALRTALS